MPEPTLSPRDLPLELRRLLIVDGRFPDPRRTGAAGFCGLTLGLLRAYRLPESREIYQVLEWAEIARTALRSTLFVPRTLARCARMRRRWPWTEFEAYLPVPLVELREEFGIEPLPTGTHGR